VPAKAGAARPVPVKFEILSAFRPPVALEFFSFNKCKAKKTKKQEKSYLRFYRELILTRIVTLNQVQA
jgi:hypothetical protein